ncbi:MAG: arsenate reductase ArsC [Thermoanaerobaculia bacterium]
MEKRRLRVLFVCTGNSARSQIAEALLRQLSGGRIDVFSAGSAPRPEIHPLARRVLQDVYQIDTSTQFPKSWDRYLREPFDYIITVCDRAAESCPAFPGDPERIRWSFPDPAAVTGNEIEQRRAFERTATEMAGRLRIWLSLPRVRAAIESDEKARQPRPPGGVTGPPEKP